MLNNAVVKPLFRCKDMAGHSKWANIKHRKAAADAKRGKVFTRVSKEITIAARNGGGDPTANPRLRMAIQNAKAANMAGDKIQKAIQKGTGEVEGVTYEEYMYEGYAPAGVAVIVEVVTDNKNRTVAEIRHLFNKYGGNLGETNSVAWNFERKGTIRVRAEGLDEDSMLEHVLEAGADDMNQADDEFTIFASPDSFSECQAYFEGRSDMELQESKFELIPKNTVKPEGMDEARRVIKFLDAFDDNDDVQNVYSNLELSDDVAAQLEAQA